MSEADHKIKRLHIPVKEEEDKKQDEKDADRLANFEWSDDGGTEDELDELDGSPLEYGADAINECVNLLSKVLLKNLHKNNVTDLKTGVGFSITVDQNLHSLLKERFSNIWTLTSRIQMFEVLRSELVAEFADVPVRQELNAKIQKVLPDSERKTFVSAEINLVDDPMASSSEKNRVIIEIPLKFEART